MRKLIIGLMLSLALSVTAFGQDAKSLDELLKLVEQGKVSEGRDNAKREQAFKQARSRQGELLQQMKNSRTREEKRGEQLETQFENNELRIADMQEALNKRLGSLKELFGVLQQVSGDARGVFESSLISIQYPGREEFLTELAKKMGTSTQLATIDEMEEVWYQLQREMTESAKISRFSTEVISANGERGVRDVVRVGAFNIVSDGKYLKYDTVGDARVVSELPKQPKKRFLDNASNILNTSDGLVTFGVDPTRGQIMSLLVQAPSLKEQVNQGGPVGYSILALGALGLLLALERLLSLFLVSRKVNAQLKADQPNSNNPLGRVLSVYDANKNADFESVELKLGEAILKETPSLTRSLMFLKIIAVVAPLMGLLGTVTGMINTFQQITLFGTGDPKLMAGGISMALVTTVLGLVVAIPMVLLHTVVAGKSGRIIHILQEQSAGIIAEHSER